MRRIRIVAVGKIKEKFFKEALNEYQKRLSRFCRLEIIEVKDFPDNTNHLEKESVLIIQKLNGTIYYRFVEGKSSQVSIFKTYRE